MIYQFISLNVNGLRTTNRGLPKRRKLFTWLKNLGAEIVLLQETHSDPRLGQVIENEWGGKCYFSHGDRNSRGVCILFHPSLKLEIVDERSCSDGRFVVLKVLLNGVAVTIGNVYGPNYDNINIFERFFSCCEELDSGIFVIGGDWNFVFDVRIDRASTARRIANNNRCRDFVNQFIEHKNLVDIWRLQNPSKRQFTYLRENPGSMSRIDFFLISERLAYQSPEPNAEILDGYLADHKRLSLKFKLGTSETGKAFWRFNDELLLDVEYVKLMRKLITETVEENDTDDVSRHTLLQTVLCVVRGETIKYVAYQKKKGTEALRDLERRIKEIENDNTPYEIEELRRLKVDRDELIEQRTKNNMFHCKVRWREKAERGTKYFHNLIRRFRGPNVYESLELEHTAPGKQSSKTSDMLEECAVHFENRYRLVPSQTANDASNFFAGIKKLSPEQSKACDVVITENELGATLRAMKNGASPGPDGFTVGFYKIFWKELKILVTQVTSEMFNNGSVPALFKCSVTTLIPKKGKDRRLVKNLRPISLLNVVYKLLTKTLANRLGNVIQSIISEDQTGFLKGRFIGENVRLVIDAIRLAKEFSVPGLLLFCDFEQAYDCVSWEYLKATLLKFGFGDVFRKWIGMLYTDDPEVPVSARISLNGQLSRPYIIRRGLRQGCPLSCLLFLLCIEPLAHGIRIDERIKGLRVGEMEVKVSNYADDTTVMMDGSEASLNACMEQFANFGRISGLTLNRRKTVAMWIGRLESKTEKIGIEYDLDWATGTIEYLGIRIGPASTDLAGLNYPEKILKLQRTLNPWLKRGLTPFGRIHLIKTVALSQLVYTMSVLEKPTKQQLKVIERSIFNFIWNKKKDKIKRKTMKNEYLLGGFKVPDPSLQADSLKITWVRKYMDGSTDGKWKQLIKVKLDIADNLNIFQCNLSQAKLNTFINDAFWLETIKAWQKVNSGVKVSTRTILNESLWFNQAISLDNHPSVPKQKMISRGVLRVKDLCDARERVMSCGELQRKYKFGNFLMWHTVLQALPGNWKRMIAAGRSGTDEEPEIDIYETIQRKRKIAGWAYSLMLKESDISIPEKAQNKWEGELRVERESWNDVFKSVYELTNDFKLRWLQLRILHRILATNKMLFIFHIRDDGKCDRCSDPSENILHIFWDCPSSNEFWIDFQQKLAVTRSLSPSMIILGIDDENSPIASPSLRLGVLLGKAFIWQCRNNGVLPRVVGFMEFLKRHLEVEQYIAETVGKTEKFHERFGQLMMACDA